MTSGDGWEGDCDFINFQVSSCEPSHVSLDEFSAILSPLSMSSEQGSESLLSPMDATDSDRYPVSTDSDMPELEFSSDSEHQEEAVSDSSDSEEQGMLVGTEEDTWTPIVDLDAVPTEVF